MTEVPMQYRSALLLPLASTVGATPAGVGVEAAEAAPPLAQLREEANFTEETLGAGGAGITPLQPCERRER